MIVEVPALRENDRGLLVVDWPHGRRDEFVMPPDMFEALVTIANMDRQLAHEIAKAALDVCARWEHDGVDDGKMGDEIARLRRAIAGET